MAGDNNLVFERPALILLSINIDVTSMSLGGGVTVFSAPELTSSPIAISASMSLPTTTAPMAPQLATLDNQIMGLLYTDITPTSVTAELGSPEDNWWDMVSSTPNGSFSSCDSATTGWPYPTVSHSAPHAATAMHQPVTLVPKGDYHYNFAGCDGAFKRKEHLKRDVSR